MGSDFKINENLVSQVALLSTAAACVFTGGLEGPAVAAYSLFAASTLELTRPTIGEWFKKLRSKNPEHEKVIRKIQNDVNQSLIGNPYFASIDPIKRGEVDEYLAAEVSKFWPMPGELIKLANKDKEFPEAVAEYVTDKIKKQVFAPTVFKDGIFDDYAGLIIRAALESALNDPDYFKKLEPNILMETLELSAEAVRGIRKLETLATNISTLGNAVSEVKAYLGDIRQAVEEIRTIQHELVEGLREDNGALRADIERLREEIQRLLAENIKLRERSEGHVVEVPIETIRPLARLLENPQGQAERDATEYLLLDEPDLRAAILALEKRDEEEEDDFETAKKKLLTTKRQIAAAAFFVDGKKSLETFKRITEIEPKDVDAWNQVGRLARRFVEYDQARAAYKKITEIGEERGEQNLIALGIGNEGIVDDAEGDYEEAIKKFNAALDIAREEKWTDNIATQLASRAGAKYKQSKQENGINTSLLHSAREDLFEAVSINEINNAHIRVAQCYDYLCIVERLLDNLYLARKYGKIALTIYRRGGWKDGEASTLNGLANVAKLKFIRTGKIRFWRRAIENYEAAKKINQNLNRGRGVALNLQNIGSMFLMIGENKQAEESFNEALDIATKLGLKELIIELEVQFSLSTG